VLYFVYAGVVVYSVVASDTDSDDSSLSLHLDSNTFQLWNYGNRGNITLLKSLNFEVCEIVRSISIKGIIQVLDFLLRYFADLHTR